MLKKVSRLQLFFVLLTLLSAALAFQPPRLGLKHGGRRTSSSSPPPRRARALCSRLHMAKKKQTPRPRRSSLGSWMCEFDVEGSKGRHFIALYDDGAVALVKDDLSNFKEGRWQVVSNEFQFTLGLPEDLKYVGQMREFSTLITGSVIEGEMDPVPVGKFSLTPIEAEMSAHLKGAIKINEERDDRTPIYSKAALAGDWMVIHCNDSGVFKLRLEPDGTFQSIGGIGDTGCLKGRWNTWDKDKMILTMVKVKSRGANMTADHQYWGLRIDGDGKEPTQVSGTIMYGYLEPTSMGKFMMAKVT